MRFHWISLLILLCSSSAFAQFSNTDTLVCGDTLLASFDPLQQVSSTDSFYVWIGNCPSQITFDFTTASVPDAADIFYLDLQGNRQFAGSMPYFGGNCTGGNYFSDPRRFPASTSMMPQHCLPGFVELYGAGVPLQDSILQRSQLPADFRLGGGYWESARLHLDIPGEIVALLFVIKFNPSQPTVLQALWDCTPNCCVTATGDSVCVGENVQLGTMEEAISYSWTGPNGFVSAEREPVLRNVEKQAEGWYKVEAGYLFGCTGEDSVYVQVNGPEISLGPDTVLICLGSEATLTAHGGSVYQWDMTSAGIISTNTSTALVAPQIPTRYRVSSQDAQGCVAEASAWVIPQELALDFEAVSPTCMGYADGSIQFSSQQGLPPFSIRIATGPWQVGEKIEGLAAGTYQVEVRDNAGCTVTESVIIEEAESVSAAIGINPPSCMGTCDGGLNILPVEGKAPYNFFLNNTPIESLASDLCAGLYTVNITDARGCGWTEDVRIEEPVPFRVDLGKNRKVKEGHELSLEVEASERIEEIYWPGYCEENCQNTLTFTPDSSMWQSVEVWNEWGCQAIDSVYIRVKKKAECVEGIYAPTAFTPNGDGVNEQFTLYADTEETDIAQLAQLSILNKWGNIIWSKSGMPLNAPELGWNGYAKGKKVPEGAYTWVGSFIREDGLSFKCGGSIIVMR